MPTIPLGASIQAAIDANPAGTVFQLADGTYYGQQFQPLNGDQFIGASDGKTVLSGALVLNKWTQSGSYWVESGLPAPLRGQIISGSQPTSSDLNDLFINNTLYARVASLSDVRADTWYFDPSTNSVVISDNPTGKTVTYSVTPYMTAGNGTTGVVIKNLTVQQYATDAQQGAIEAVSNWQLDNVTATENHGAGVNIGAGTIIQGGSYSENGQVGIEGYQATGAQVLNAAIANNNYAGYDAGWDAGGLKMSSSSSVTISGNNVYGNNGQGIWADIDSSNWTISNNTVTNNNGAGIQYEISHGATSIRNNTLSGNTGAGVFISNSDGVTVSGNSVTVGGTNTGSSTATADGGIDIINTNRGQSPITGLPYQSTNDTVSNNVIVHTTDTASDGIYYYQKISGTPNNIWTNNTYDVPNSSGTYWYFDDRSYTWADLQQAQPYGNAGTLNIATPTLAPTPVPKSTSTVSQDGTTILSPADAPITDAQGNTWSLVASASSGWQVAENGVVDTLTKNVDLLQFEAGKIIQANNQDQFYSEDATAPGSWRQIAQPSSVASADHLLLRLSEDAYQGDAQFTISVNGKQVGGPQTVTALHSTGDAEDFTFAGNWPAGALDVQVSFINDAYGGSPSLDRNLYVNSITYDGASFAGATMFGSATKLFSVSTSSAASPPSDTLVLHMSEDAYQGDATFVLTIDGKTVTAPTAVTSLHSSNQWQTLQFSGTLGAGQHVIGVRFADDLYGGSSTSDRNLYVDGIGVNGTQYGTGVSALYRTGDTASYTITTAH